MDDYRDATDEELKLLLEHEKSKKSWRVYFECEGEERSLIVSAIQLHETVIKNYVKKEYGEACEVTKIERWEES